MAHLSIENLKKTYGTATIIGGLSLSVDEGAFVALLGPSGSGKTTVLRCLAGLEMPDADSGAIRLGGTVWSERSAFLAPEKRGIGMVFQNYAVWPHLNVLSNVSFPLTIGSQRLGKVKAAKTARAALDLVKLGAYAGRFPHELSGGQQQRVALARALVVKPSLLLLVEPLSNLDALLREELGAEIRRLQREMNLTTILVTHDQKEALAFADRIVLLQQGRITADGTPEALYAAPPNDFAAEFLAGGQSLKVGGDNEKTFLPRRWLPLPSGEAPAQGGRSLSVEIATRIFRGSEYEYFAKSSEVQETIRFFSSRRLEAGERVTISYADDVRAAIF